MEGQRGTGVSVPQSPEELLEVARDFLAYRQVYGSENDEELDAAYDKVRRHFDVLADSYLNPLKAIFSDEEMEGAVESAELTISEVIHSGDIEKEDLFAKADESLSALFRDTLRNNTPLPARPLESSNREERRAARIALKAVRNRFVNSLPKERRQQARQALGPAIHDILNMPDLNLADAPSVFEKWLDLDPADDKPGRT